MIRPPRKELCENKPRSWLKLRWHDIISSSLEQCLPATTCGRLTWKACNLWILKPRPSSSGWSQESWSAGRQRAPDDSATTGVYMWATCKEFGKASSSAASWKRQALSWVLKSGLTMGGQGDWRGFFARGNKLWIKLRRQRWIIFAELTMLIYIVIQVYWFCWTLIR